MMVMIVVMMPIGLLEMLFRRLELLFGKLELPFGKLELLFRKLEVPIKSQVLYQLSYGCIVLRLFVPLSQLRVQRYSFYL